MIGFELQDSVCQKQWLYQLCHNYHHMICFFDENNGFIKNTLSSFLFLSFSDQSNCFLNWPSSASFRLFSSFQTNNTLFTTNQCKKCPSSIQHPDSNPWPLKHELTLITTRPGLPTLSKQLLKQLFPDKKISQHICFLYFLLLLLLFG